MSSPAQSRTTNEVKRAGSHSAMRRSKGPSSQPVSPAYEDRALIDAALSGDATAWERLYEQCHEPLMIGVRAMLGAKRTDNDVAEELAAQVWYSVVRNHGELLSRFDPSRGRRLTTFLSALAKDLAVRMFRSERRRRRREAISCEQVLQNGSGVVAATDAASIALTEFEATLTKTEKQFFREIVPGDNPPGAKSEASRPNRSRANQWQLRHRVRRKLELFLDS